MTSNMPGRIPPTYRSLMLIVAATPYRITGSAGGKRRPTLPELVSKPVLISKPVLKFSEYFLFNRAIERKPPRASIVTPDAPVSVVKIAQTITATIPSPPGSHPKRFRKSRTKRSPALLSERKKPARVKSGMAGISCRVRTPYASCGISPIGSPAFVNQSTASPPRTIKIGFPKNAEIMSRIMHGQKMIEINGK
jgi:hypothetical protein